MHQRAQQRRHLRASARLACPSPPKTSLPSVNPLRLCLFLGRPSFPNKSPPATGRFWAILASTPAELGLAAQAPTPRRGFHHRSSPHRSSQSCHRLHWRPYRLMQVPICLGSYPPQQISC